MTVDDLQQALAALNDGSDAVIAPAEDGGYVLIGLKAPQPNLFNDIAWGSDQVMAQTRQRLSSAGLQLHELMCQWHVDTIEDWRRFVETQPFSRCSDHSRYTASPGTVSQTPPRLGIPGG